MIRARPLPLAIIALVVFAIVLLVLRWLHSAGTLFPASPVLPVFVAAFAGLLLALGLRVRRFVAGRASMDAIAASRVAALAVSGAFVGATMFGAGLAQVVSLIGRLAGTAARADALVGAATALLSLVLIAVALLVQRWCQVDESDSDDDGTPTPPGATA